MRLIRGILPGMLAASRLGKRFGGRWIFRGIDLDLSAGQSLVILGHNGSGKSTLLKLLAGLLGPSEGEVRHAGRLGVSTLEMSVYPHLSVREHLELSARMRGCPSRTDELLDKIGLADAADRHGSQLSTGMKSRLKLAIAIQHEPEVLLLDEPGAALDEMGKELIAEICREQVSRGLLVIATNDPAERRYASFELELGR